MRPPSAWLLSMVLVACAPARPRETSAPREVVTAAPASTDAAVPDSASPIDTVDAADSTPVAISSACPATYGGGGACLPSTNKCEYPDGTCTCAGASYCGGAAPRPEDIAALKKPRWICAPSPKKLGPDGCPLGDPSGLPCGKEGKQCHYMPCCAVTVTCTNGKWLPGSPNCPP